MKVKEKLKELREQKIKLKKLSEKIEKNKDTLSEKDKKKLVEKFKKKKEEESKKPVKKETKEKTKKETENTSSSKSQEHKVSKKTEKKKEDKKPKKEKKKKSKRSFYEQKKYINTFLEKAGINTKFDEINKKILIVTCVLIALSTIFLIVKFIINKTFFLDVLGFLLSLWIFGTIACIIVLWLGFLIFADLRVFQRKKELEEVFPDYLQLTAANINAGMPIDRALWYAIRPRFGILAKEMEDVAKATMVGKKLDVALLEFSDKYDSIQIKRTLNLLLEGLESGGEIGDLLNRVAINMSDTAILKKEMASNVTTYVIFILFATLGAAPFLFGLTTELLVIMNSIFANINIDSSSTSSFGGIGSMLAGSGEAISLKDYQIFVVVSMVMSSFFAAILISIIQKGNTKEAVKKIPLYIIIGLVIYFIAFKALHLFLGGFFN